jgi:hypothetical protein
MFVTTLYPADIPSRSSINDVEHYVRTRFEGRSEGPVFGLVYA